MFNRTLKFPSAFLGYVDVDQSGKEQDVPADLQYKGRFMQGMSATIVELLKGENWLAISIVVAIVIAWRLRSIVEYLDWHRSRRLQLLRSSLDSPALDPASRELIEEEYRSINLYLTCRVRGEAPVREAIVALNKASGRELQYRDLAKASRYLTVKDGRPRIVIPGSDLAEWFFHNVIGGVLLVGSVSLFFLMMTIHPLNGAIVFRWTVTAFFLSFTGLFLAFQTVPVTVARRIAPLVERFAKQMENEQANKE